MRTEKFDRDWLNAALKLTGEDHEALRYTGCYASTADEWPWIMLAQRYAWRDGPGYALNRLNFLLKAREGATSLTSGARLLP